MVSRTAGSWFALPRFREPFYAADRTTGLLSYLVTMALLVGLFALPAVSRFTGVTVGEFLVVTGIHASVFIPYCAWPAVHRHRLYALMGHTLFSGLCCLLVYFSGDPRSPLWVFYLLYVGNQANSCGVNAWLLLNIVGLPLLTGLALHLGAAGPAAETWFSVGTISLLGSIFYWFIGALTDKFLALVRQNAETEQILAVERERARLARELHDCVSSRLAGIAARCWNARREEGDADREALEAVERASREGLGELRNVLFAIGPEGSSLSALVANIRRYTSDLLTPSGVEVRVEDRTGRPVLDLPARLVLAGLRLVQEAGHNAHKHAGASTFTVTFRALPGDPEELEVAVRDDGRGFDPQEAAGCGRGLDNMRQRTAAAGGRLEIHAAPGQGTQVLARFPLEDPLTNPT